MMDGFHASIYPNGVRRAMAHDVLHMIRIARRAYFDWPVDWGHVAAWLSANVERPEVFACVAPGAATIAMAQDWFWRPGVPEVSVLFVAGNGHIWDTVRCLRATAGWGHSLGAERMKIDAETGMNLGPLAARIGLPVERVPAFTVRLR